MIRKTPELIRNEVLAEYAHLLDTDENNIAMAQALLQRFQLYGYALELQDVAISEEALDLAQSDYENAQFDYPELDL